MRVDFRVCSSMYIVDTYGESHQNKEAAPQCPSAFTSSCDQRVDGERLANPNPNPNPNSNPHPHPNPSPNPNPNPDPERIAWPA